MAKVQIEESALETMKIMVQKLQDERDMLLKAAKLGLSVSESWVHEQLEGTSIFDGAMKALQPIRDAIAACTESTKVIEP